MRQRLGLPTNRRTDTTENKCVGHLRHHPKHDERTATYAATRSRFSRLPEENAGVEPQNRVRGNPPEQDGPAAALLRQRAVVRALGGDFSE
jgi:hypothetical protein